MDAHRPASLAALAAALALLLGACVPATVEPWVLPTPDMTDAVRVPVRLFEMGYEPAEFRVPAGPVIFELNNEGVVDHEFVIGPEEFQAHHAAEMEAGEQLHHTDSHVTLKAGESLELPIFFYSDGETLIGCHLPGHYEAGMKGRIVIYDEGRAL